MIKGHLCQLHWTTQLQTLFNVQIIIFNITAQTLHLLK